MLTATIFDLQGRRLLRQLLKTGPNTVSVSRLAAALYVLEIRYGKETGVLKVAVAR